MAMNPLTLAPLITAQIIQTLAAQGWGVTMGPPTEGTQAGNASTAPSKIILDLATAVGLAVATQVIFHIQTHAEVTGPDTQDGDTHPAPATPPFTPPVIS